jgi:hypothetical protein
VLALLTNNMQITDVQCDNNKSQHAINRIPVMARRGRATFWGVFFVGAYFPQKVDLHPPIETQRVSE